MITKYFKNNFWNFKTHPIAKGPFLMKNTYQSSVRMKWFSPFYNTIPYHNGSNKFNQILIYGCKFKFSRYKKVTYG